MARQLTAKVSKICTSYVLQLAGQQEDTDLWQSDRALLICASSNASVETQHGNFINGLCRGRKRFGLLYSSNRRFPT
jgi:hypothetical protein